MRGLMQSQQSGRHRNVALQQRADLARPQKVVPQPQRTAAPSTSGALGAAGAAGGRRRVAAKPKTFCSSNPHQSTTQLLKHEPLSTLDVDAELWQVLDLCTDEELEALHAELHDVSPLSPVVKSLMSEKEPLLLEQRGRPSVMHRIEARFRFLAADSTSLIQGRRPSYRDTLLAIRDRLDVPCSANLSTYDLETELFLHILQNCAESVQGHSDPAAVSEAAAVALMEAEGDGMSQASASQPSSSGRSSSSTHWTERLTAPIRFGIKELVPTVAKLGSALTVSAVGRTAAQRLGAQLVASHARYIAAARVVCGTAASAGAKSTGSTLAANWGKQAALEAAQKGLTAATARYSAVQGALSFLGPLMWGWLAVDLALKSIGTDYARIIRAVFILAQVRLVRTGGFTPPVPAMATVGMGGGFSSTSPASCGGMSSSQSGRAKTVNMTAAAAATTAAAGAVTVAAISAGEAAPGGPAAAAGEECERGNSAPIVDVKPLVPEDGGSVVRPAVAEVSTEEEEEGEEGDGMMPGHLHHGIPGPGVTIYPGSNDDDDDPYSFSIDDVYN